MPQPRGKASGGSWIQGKCEGSEASWSPMSSVLWVLLLEGWEKRNKPDFQPCFSITFLVWKSDGQTFEPFPSAAGPYFFFPNVSS